MNSKPTAICSWLRVFFSMGSLAFAGWGCGGDTGDAGDTGDTGDAEAVRQTSERLISESIGTATLTSAEVACNANSSVVAQYGLNGSSTVVAQSKCREVKIHCDSLANGPSDAANDLVAQLAVRTPASPTGVAFFLSGGEGTAWADPGYNADAYNRGLRTVKVRWKGLGWPVGVTAAYDGRGLRKNACRAATVFKYIYDTWGRGSAGMPSSGVAFCGQGKSGGSAELMYALTAYGQKDLFDYAQLVAGPPYTKVDMMCSGVRAQDRGVQIPFDACPAYFVSPNTEEIPASMSTYLFNGPSVQFKQDQYAGTGGTSGCGVTTRPTPDPNRDAWLHESVWSISDANDPARDSDFDYPQTKVDVNICRTNANPTYWGGNVMYHALASMSSGPKAVHCWGNTDSGLPGYDDCEQETYAAGTFNGHTVTGAGLTDQFAQMASGCVARHGQ